MGWMKEPDPVTRDTGILCGVSSKTEKIRQPLGKIRPLKERQRISYSADEWASIAIKILVPSVGEKRSLDR